MSKPEYYSLGLARDSAWRQQPASTGQQDFILKKLKPSNPESREIEGVWVGAKLGTSVKVDDLTKGEASDLISRTKHGGVGFVKRFKRVHQREMREKSKIEGKDRRVGRMLEEELELATRRRERRSRID